MIPQDDQNSIDMIRESAQGLADRRDLKRVRALRYTPHGFDRTIWRQMCDMGWPALRLAEEQGGIGLSMQAYCALAGELGAALVPEPLIGAVISAAMLTGDALKDHLSGERIVLPAWQDRRDTLEPERPLKMAGGKVSARKLFVPMAAGADDFLLIGNGQAVLVAADAPGVSIDAKPTQDGGHFAVVTFETEASAIAVDPAPVLAEATLATSAYLLGLMDAALERTVDYLKTRVQFGKKIGSFQVLQHMAVDLKLQVELTRTSIEDAAARWDRDGAVPRSYAAVSRAKARASQAAMQVARDAIQLHGGIGFTDEHDIGLYLRKAMVVAPQFGSAKAHRARYAQIRPVAGQEA
jgi:alkylation response protein AidB-like acyl-CoA dehydrogenase